MRQPPNNLLGGCFVRNFQLCLSLDDFILLHLRQRLWPPRKLLAIDVFIVGTQWTANPFNPWRCSRHFLGQIVRVFREMFTYYSSFAHSISIKASKVQQAGKIY